MPADKTIVSKLNRERSRAVRRGKDPYEGSLKDYDAFSRSFSNPLDQPAPSTPTVISDTTVRERVIPELQQEATEVLTRGQQARQQRAQERQMRDQAKLEEKESSKDDPLASLFGQEEEAAPLDPVTERQLATLEQLKESNDDTTRSLANRYQQLYDSQRSREQARGAAEAGSLQTGLRRQGIRYTPGGMGQAMSGVQAGTIRRLADIDDEEMLALDELRAAQETKDYELVNEKLELLKGVREERMATLEEARETERADAETLEKNRTDILKSLGESGAPPDVIAAVSQAGDVAEMVTLAGSNLQTGEYAEYARAVRNAGLTPVDATTYYSKKIYGEKGPPGSEMFGGAVPFESTIDGAATFAGTADVTQQNARAQLTALAQAGDYPALLTRLEQLGRKGMGQAQGDEIFKAQNQVKSITDLQAVLDEYEALGGELGPIPATEKAMAARIGQLAGDPRFSELATRMTAAFQKYRQEMSGAAFGVQENAEYKKVIPTADKSNELNRAVIGGLKEFLENNVDNAYETQLGEGYKNVKDYVDLGLSPDGKKLLKTEQEAKEYALSLSEGDENFENQIAAIKNDNPEWSYQEILENMGISSSGLAAKPSSGNRPQRNNNPGNVKAGGLADQYAIQNPDGTPMTDEEGHLIFGSPEDGAKALRADINAKVSGNSPAAQRKLGRQVRTLSDLNAVYAEDPNWKNNVAKFAGVSVDTPVNAIPRETLISAIMKAEGFLA